MKRISFFATLAIFLFSAAFAMGQGIGPGWGLNPGLLSALNLTAEQTENIRSLRESFEKETAPLRTQIFERKAEMRLLWMQMNADPEKTKAKQKEIHDLKWQMQEKVTDLRLAFRGLLTPEQLSKLLALGGERGHHGRKKGWRGRPGCSFGQERGEEPRW